MLQMPPHINNSLEISVKQLKNNSNGQQFSTLANVSSLSSSSSFNTNSATHHQQQQTESLPLGITNLNSGSLNSSISNHNSNISLINNQQQQQLPPQLSQQQTQIQFSSTLFSQNSVNFNFLSAEIDDFITNSSTNNNTNLNHSLGDEESIDDDLSDLESNLSMDGMRNDSLITSNLLSNNNNNITSTNLQTNNNNTNSNAHLVTNNQYDIYSTHLDAQVLDHNQFSVKPETFDTTNMYTCYDQSDYIYPHQMYPQMPQIASHPNEPDYLAGGSSSNTGGYTHLQIKKEQLDDQTNSSFSSADPEIGSSWLSSAGKSGKTGPKVEKRYGPIVVRPRKNPAPTLRTGRKSKYIALSPEEEKRRDLRRERNRHAAEKCKQKRCEIEETLESNLKHLLNEKANIENERARLLEKKLCMEKLLKQHLEQCQYLAAANQFQVNQLYTTNTTNPNSTSTSSSTNSTQFNTSLSQQQQQQQQQQQSAHNYTMLNTTNQQIQQSASNGTTSSTMSGYNYQHMNQIQAPYDQYSQQHNMNNSSLQAQSHANKLNHLTSFSNF